jgi:hypothetical protein
MKLGIYFGVSGMKVTLKLKPNQDVLTYVVFVKKYNRNSEVREAVLTPNVLESEDGASFTLRKCLGYKLILNASIRPEGDAQMRAVLTLEAEDKHEYPMEFALPSLEGPVVGREWSIAMIDHDGNEE